MKKKVAIIGAGIAGLTLASLLKTNSNFEFVIYEKGEVFNFDEGFGVQLSVNGISILNKIGFINPYYLNIFNGIVSIHIAYKI